MKNVKLILLYGLYAVIVTGFGAYQYYHYQKSFEKVVPYSHTMKIQPTEPVSETIPETQVCSETIVSALSSETVLTIQTELIQTTLPVSTNPPMTTIVAVTQPIEPIQEEFSEITEETELIVNYPLNLNTATWEELCTLPEIGEVIAQNIIDYREQIGGFINREQLLEVSRIGEHRYSVIFSYLMIEDEQPMPEEVQQPEPDLIPEPDPILVEIPEPETTPPTKPPEIPYINLNTTTKEQLLLLPDCNEEIAQSIIDLREIHIHTFSNPLEILYVNDIARKTIIPNELYFAWEEYLFVDDFGGKQLDLYGTH